MGTCLLFRHYALPWAFHEYQTARLQALYARCSCFSYLGTSTAQYTQFGLRDELGEGGSVGDGPGFSLMLSPPRSMNRRAFPRPRTASSKRDSRAIPPTRAGTLDPSNRTL